MDWYLLDIPTAVEKQKADPLNGLSSADVEERLKTFGRNELQDPGGTSGWRILWGQFTSTMSLLLIGAAVLSWLVGSPRDSMTIMAIVCLFAMLGFIQEFRAE